MMKNILVSALLLLIISASNVHSQINIGVKAGLNLNDKYAKIEQIYNLPTTPAPTKLDLGYHLGVNVSYELNSSFSLLSGIVYVSKGSSTDLQEFYTEPYPSFPSADVKVEGYSRENYNYLEMPLQLSYKVWKGLSIYGGPYTALGLSGRDNDDYKLYINGNLYFEYQSNDPIKPIYKEKKLNIPISDRPQLLYDLPHEFNGFDYGVNLGIGYEFRNFILSSEYSLGLGNVEPRYSNFPRHTHRHRVLYFSLGYVLFKK